MITSESYIDAPFLLLNMVRLGRRGFLAVAVIFHVIYAVSIFDIYFVSPIVSGMAAFAVKKGEAPAKRLVLFVGMLTPLSASNYLADLNR